MPCEKCQGGYWQCSDTGDPCGMSFRRSGTLIDTQEHYFQVLTMGTGKGCRMRVRMTGAGDTAPNGWNEEGKIGLRFRLYESAADGECYVRVEDLTRRSTRARQRKAGRKASKKKVSKKKPSKKKASRKKSVKKKR